MESILTNDEFKYLCYKYILELRDCDYSAFIYTIKEFVDGDEKVVAEFMERLSLVEDFIKG